MSTAVTQKEIREKLSVLKKYQNVAEHVLFPLILLIYPFAGLGRGLDLADITYALGNYRFFGSLDPMWKLSTFLPNVLGRLLTYMPWGSAVTGMEFYCTFLVCLTALISYYLLRRWFSALIVFAGEFLAESLFWCPPAILYNTMSSLFLACGLLILMHAATDHKQHAWKYVLAGIFFGMNVMVRLPNVIYAVFIAALSLYGTIHGSKRRTASKSLNRPSESKKQTVKPVVWKLSDIWKRSGLCVIGWCLGFGIPFLATVIFYGTGAYAGMISELLLVSRDAADYSGVGQFALIASAYGHTLRSMLIMIPCLAAAAVIVMLRPGRDYWVKRLLVFAGFLLLFVYYYRSGVFTSNYRYFDSVFEPVQMFMILGLVMLIPAVTPYMGGGGSERTWALISVLIILLTPLGSNNYTYPVLNNLFIPAPVILSLFARFRNRLGRRDQGIRGKQAVAQGDTALNYISEIHFSWKALFYVLVLVILVQGVLFHMNYSFGDGYDGEPLETSMEKAITMSAEQDQPVDSAGAVSSMLHTTGNIRTGADKAEELVRLAMAIDNEEMWGYSLLEFGSAPGLNYLFDMRLAKDTSWPSLNSYRADRFADSLQICREKERPVVVLDKDYLEMLEATPDTEGMSAKDKAGMLAEYMDECGYRQIYDGSRFAAYAP